jgi:lysosomal acid lipase/cholesteryl ester hydrolase
MALMLVVPHALVQWLHLVIIAAILLLTTLGSTCTRAFYRAAVALGLDHQLDLMYLRVREIRRLFAWRLGSGRDHDTAKRSAFALSSPELIEAEGFRCEEHVVTTPDGYILTLHRIVPREDAHGRSAAPRHHAHPEPSCASEPAPFMRISAVNGNGGRGERPPPVLFVHGLMQSSECWLLGGRDASLPMRLADRSDGGPTYDVWLANIRGCFYSQKHLRLSPDQNAFWDFDLDSIARYDVPCTIEYILAATGYGKLAVTGFSQGGWSMECSGGPSASQRHTVAFLTHSCSAGSAILAAALSLFPHLNERVSVFAALSPAIAVRGLARSPVTALVEADLSFIYLLFGRRQLVPIAVDVMRVLSGSAWASLLDGGYATERWPRLSFDSLVP